MNLIIKNNGPREVTRAFKKITLTKLGASNIECYEGAVVDTYGVKTSGMNPAIGRKN